MYSKYLLLLMVLCGLNLNAQTSGIDFNLVSKSLEAMNPVFDIGTARYAAMAGSMGALGGDMSAVSINPAATGVFITSTLQATMDYNDQTNTTTLGNTLKRNDGYFGFNQIGGVFSFDEENKNWKRFNLGILYEKKALNKDVRFAKNDLLSNYDFDVNGNYVDEYKFDGYQQVLNGRKEKFTIAFGTNYQNKLYLGANLNIHSYTTDYEHNYFGYLESNDETYTFSEWAYPYRENGTGFSFGIGAIYRPVKIVRLGFAFTSPIGWSQISTEYDEYYYDTTSGLVDTSVGIGLFEEDRANSAAMMTVSAGAVIKKSIAINFDYIRHFNNFNKYKPNSVYVGTNNFLDNYTENVNEFRMGIEYKYKNLKLRGGYATVSSPSKPFTLSDGYTDGNNNLVIGKDITHFAQGTKEVFGFGLGYEFENVFIDLAFQQQKQSYNTVLSEGIYVDPGFYPLDFQNYVGEVKQKNDNYILSIGYTF